MRSGVAAACERILVGAARAHGAGTRQQRRAAARRFVRRHRRDASYLAWVLRSVGASSALAVALLGLGAPARAQQTLFTPLTGAANPLAGLDVGIFSAPAFGDLDDDGDLDLVSGARSGRFAWFENTGSASAPAYLRRTGAQNPLDAQDVGYSSAPALGDLDGDGDLDLVSGEEQGGFFYFENTGTPASPAFVARTGAQNPLDGHLADDDSTPALGDLDGDGDLDLVAGGYGGAFAWFENTGSAASAAFAQRTGAQNPLDGHEVEYYSTPALGDIDFDGDLDLVAGELNGGLRALENTGGASTPAFAALPDQADPLDGVSVSSFAAPALADLDADGDPDIVAGVTQGVFYTLQNRAGLMLQTSFLDVTDPLGGYPAPALADLDADGDLDILSGDLDGQLRYFESTGSTTNPLYLRRTGSANPLDGVDVGTYSGPAFGDLDGDGDFDLVVGPSLRYFENTGSASAPAFVQRTGAANPFNGFYGAWPSFGDLDADGDLDLVAGSGGSFFYFQNSGTSASPAFIARTGAQNPFNGFSVGGVGGFAAPCLADLDADGDLDMTAGHYPSDFTYFENTGSAASPAYLKRTDPDNPLRFLVTSYLSAHPSAGDLDGDGDIDLVSGVNTGTTGGFIFFENAIVKPSISLLSVPEPGHGPMLGAGSALLAWLARWRTRRRPR